MFANNRVHSNTNAPGYSSAIRNKVDDGNGNEVYIIDPSTFANIFINNISGLFKNSNINIPF